MNSARLAPAWTSIVLTLVGSWYGMQAIHEAGHVWGAWSSGGRVERVVLAPWSISRTDLSENPAPLWVSWSGPVFGATFPLVAWGVAAGLGWRRAFLVRFFAGFCLVANGLYLGAGSFSGAGDCGDLLRHGAPIELLWLFGAIAVPSGLWLWHGQGKHFGLGRDQRGAEAEPRAT